MEKWSIIQRHETAALPDLPLLSEVDVLVVGAGSSGVAAAVMAARSGLKTLIVEKYGFCGGSAVAGMSGTICGMFMGREDRAKAPEQIVYGMAETFRAALDLRGGVTGPQHYGKTFTVTHDPMVWREAADDLLLEAGAEVLYHTAVESVIMEGDTYRGVVLESNAGKSMLMAKIIIDASGDAAVVSRAGHAVYFGDEGAIQNPTMIFRIGGVDLERYAAFYGDDTICPAKVTEEILKVQAKGTLDLPRHKIWIFPTTRPGELMVNATRLAGQDGRILNVIDPADFTESEIFGRRQARDYATFLKETVPGCEESFINDMAVEVGIRQTRSVVGKTTLTNDDVVGCRKREDGIARSAWPIELHSGTKPKLHWLLEDYYEIPLDALIPEKGENIIVCGRNLAAEHEALASARVTAQCFEYGHAAAVAAAKAIRENRSIREIPGEEVRAEMKRNGSAL